MTALEADGGAAGAVGPSGIPSAEPTAVDTAHNRGEGGVHIEEIAACVPMAEEPQAAAPDDSPVEAAEGGTAHTRYAIDNRWNHAKR